MALVVLKRLADAIAAGDTIRAVIRGSAVGNDGADKIGYTAPGQRGQVEVIARAHADAGVEPESIELIEAHGTATRLGDPIEVAALTEAFRARTERRGFCALGSVKSNLGHLGAAAGVTGLIKATLALERRKIPPTLHFRAPNPELRLADSPFFVNTEPLAWTRRTGPRRAGVSAFGVGGTNAHVVLEEAPRVEPSGPARPWQLLPLSARTEAALGERADLLAAHMQRHAAVPLADIAFTLQQRPALAPARRVVVARERGDAIAALAGRGAAAVVSGAVRPRAPKLVFVFPGVGSQYVGMAGELYAQEPLFRTHLDACAERFAAELGVDIRRSIFPAAGDAEAAARRLLAPSLNMAAIFTVEHALSQLLLAWGLTPAALIGHSLGEYTAAHLAGVMSLDDAIALVAARGRLCDERPDAAMLSVPLSEADTTSWLGPGLSLAVVNGPAASVVAGTRADIERLAGDLGHAGIDARMLPVALASHSSLMDPFVPRLIERARAAVLRAPKLPLVSCVTGTWLRDEAGTPEYWGRHLRQTVRFGAALETLFADPDHVFLEVGPSGHLASLIRRHPGAGAERVVLSAMLNPRAGKSDLEGLLLALGQLWCVGVGFDSEALSAGERRRRVPLPTYPFARTRHLIHGSVQRVAEAADDEPAEAPGDAPAPPAAADPALADPFSRALADIWAELLGVDAVRADDNFFALGGTSLIAIQVRARLLERFGVAAPVHALIETPTLRGLADALRKDAPTGGDLTGERRPPDSRTPASLLVRLKAGRTRARPLFVVQPIGGTVYSYLPLARRLGVPGSIHGIRASGMDPGEPVLEEVPAIAARALEDVLRMQESGPYVLVGHSAGGVIAYEMTRQLEARGQHATLVMIDAPSLPAVRATAIETVEDLLRDMAVFAAGDGSGFQGFVAALADGSPLRSIVLAMGRALRRYEPEPIVSDAVYIAASEQKDPRDTRAGAFWMDLARGRFSLHRSPGDHFSMMEDPHVEQLARWIDAHVGGAAVKRRAPADT